MDKQAVWLSSDSHLKELGLVEKGHIICLRGFCMPRENDNVAKDLAIALNIAGTERTKGIKR